MAKNSIEKDDKDFNEIEQEYTNLMAEDNEIDKPFEPEPTPDPPTGGIEFDMTNGVIEIKWLSGTSNNVVDKPNEPIVKKLNNGKMELVKYTRKGTTEQERWIPGNEYSYVAGSGYKDNNSSKWANARVTINGVDSYFVWIPRYAYRIIYFDSAESKKAYQEGTLTEADAVAQGKINGYSDSRGIVNKDGKKVDSIASTTKTMVSKDYFMVHPAFLNDVNAGGWTSELPGIWVGKYETSGSSSQLKVQPGASSFRSITIGKMYDYSKLFSTELKSHMLKNSEWGAVAYLTESSYGRNGTEVEQNAYNGFMTGGGTGQAYIPNKKQSSTGNEYGIYDLSGGSNDCVAAYCKDGNLNYGSSFANGKSDEYSTVYDGIDINQSYKYGDATCETKEWHSDMSNFIHTSYPFFSRGGRCQDSGVYPGIFSTMFDSR